MKIIFCLNVYDNIYTFWHYDFSCSSEHLLYLPFLHPHSAPVSNQCQFLKILCNAFENILLLLYHCQCSPCFCELINSFIRYVLFFSCALLQFILYSITILIPVKLSSHHGTGVGVCIQPYKFLSLGSKILGHNLLLLPHFHCLRIFIPLTPDSCYWVLTKYPDFSIPLFKVYLILLGILLPTFLFLETLQISQTLN